MPARRRARPMKKSKTTTAGPTAPPLPPPPPPFRFQGQRVAFLDSHMETFLEAKRAGALHDFFPVVYDNYSQCFPWRLPIDADPEQGQSYSDPIGPLSSADHNDRVRIQNSTRIVGATTTIAHLDNELMYSAEDQSVVLPQICYALSYSRGPGPAGSALMLCPMLPSP
ncbi:hypothetical protein C8R43DRAFT_947980 [Mycena crocata]|nr:hypothetical protein C8R43DRAFT_947980 [Mycena crocata]